jgi:hypothetical protein
MTSCYKADWDEASSRWIVKNITTGSIADFDPKCRTEAQRIAMELNSVQDS